MHHVSPSILLDAGISAPVAGDATGVDAGEPTAPSVPETPSALAMRRRVNAFDVGAGARR